MTAGNGPAPAGLNSAPPITLSAGSFTGIAMTSVYPPPIGGGYTDVIAIPVNDPAIKAIGGALFKPAGTGPFPAVIYMGGCSGIDSPPQRAQQAATVDHLLSKGVATLIVDPFTSRNELQGVC